MSQLWMFLTFHQLCGPCQNSSDLESQSWETKNSLGITRNTSENTNSFTDRQHNCLANPCVECFVSCNFLVSARSLHLPLHKSKQSQSWSTDNSNFVDLKLVWPKTSPQHAVAIAFRSRLPCPFPAGSAHNLCPHPQSQPRSGANPRQVVVATKLSPRPSQKQERPKNTSANCGQTGSINLICQL